MIAKLALSTTMGVAGLILAAHLQAETHGPTRADRPGAAALETNERTSTARAMTTAIGPDIICSRAGNSDMQNSTENSDMIHWGDFGGIAAYSIGTTSCNMGDEVHPWVAGASAQHPTIAQNFYRLELGRFEQIGMSWLKHGFCAVSEPTCGSCQPTDCSTLGLGCADTYTAVLNGSQGDLGPRSNVNPTTGVHSHPYPTPVGNNTIRGRLQVKIPDIDPFQHLTTNPMWYLEAQYVGEQDATAGNQHNNVSHREFSIFNLDWSLVFALGSTQPEEPAIMAWTGATIETLMVDGRYHLGHMVTDNGDGTWHYEFALYNMNSHRGAGSFAVPVPECATVTNVGFHDVDYHSGDGEGAAGQNYDGTDWVAVRSGGMLTWSTDDHAANANANALRWGTLYNFRFDADLPPAPAGTVSATVGLFRPGTPTSTTVQAAAPATPAAICVEDCDWTVRAGGCPDDDVDVADLLAVLSRWGLDSGCDLDGSGLVDTNDLLLLLGAWGVCGPV